jgi:hypothetical protein
MFFAPMSVEGEQVASAFRRCLAAATSSSVVSQIMNEVKRHTSFLICSNAFQSYQVASAFRRCLAAATTFSAISQKTSEVKITLPMFFAPMSVEGKRVASAFRGYIVLNLVSGTLFKTFNI